MANDTGPTPARQTLMQPNHLFGLVPQVSLAHTLRFVVQVSTMAYLQRKTLLAALGVLLSISCVQAQDSLINWPAGWEVEPVPTPDASSPSSTGQLRQRAVKNDENGDPAMVVELTESQLQAGHAVNVQGVLLEMRKAIQVNFARSGFQSVCTQMKAGTLSEMPTMETTCTITQNGVHVMTQTLVAAASKERAWSLSYAGSAIGYANNKDEVVRIRDSLQLNATP